MLYSRYNMFINSDFHYNGGRDYMIKNVTLVSLSAETIGEDFVKHEVNIGLKRLEEFGLNVKVMPHAMKEMSM